MEVSSWEKKKRKEKTLLLNTIKDVQHFFKIFKYGLECLPQIFLSKQQLAS